MQLKKGSKVDRLKPEMILAFCIVNNVYAMHKYQCTMSEGTGGKHMAGSLHYEGYGIDIRTKNLSTSDKPVIVAEIKATLNEQYDVIFEAENTDNEHLHIEFNV